MKKKDNIIIKYNNLLEKLADAGYNTSRIRKEHILPEATMTNIRNNRDINLRTLVKISLLTNISIEKLITYRMEK
ncbi:MAG: helix-turn-helix domain-containing protein [Methanobrevibacter sp.]|nr:helix-turn-helix domain-containing protein [Methanobrevibacter sp.]